MPIHDAQPRTIVRVGEGWQPPRQIGASRVHVFVVMTNQVAEPALLADYYALMLPEEQARFARFRFAKDRHQFLVGRILVRTTLSRFAAVEPRCWRFTTGEYGKPRIAFPEGFERISFNLSHTAGVCVCAVTDERSIGVDVESVDREPPLDVAEQFFAPDEVAYLRSLPPERQATTFFDFWTLKESYIKARGMGLSISLQEFIFELTTPPTIRFERSIDDQPSRWQFHRLPVAPRYRAALAVHAPAQARLSVEVNEVVPLIT